MKVDYKPLWKLLKIKNITKNDFRLNVKIGSSTYSKLVNNENVTVETIAKICEYLDCKVEDVVCFTKNRVNHMNYKIDLNYFNKITKHQKEQMLEDFTLDSHGNIKLEYYHKGYTVNDKKWVFRDDIKAISVFSGAGGLDIGTQLAGIKVIASLDIFEDSVKTIKQNKFFDNAFHEVGDIKKVNGLHYKKILENEKFEKLIIVGGPPCQPFSKAGYWVTNEKRDSSKDPRNLIDSYFDLIAELKPDGFVLENVESIMHKSNQETVELIYKKMSELGYHYTLLKINSADFGIPQKRKRVFFLASKNNIDAKLKKTHGNEKECKNDESLKPYERVIDWIGLFDNDINNDINLKVEGKWESKLPLIPFGKNYIALSEKANHPEPVFVAGKRYWSSLLKLHPLLPSWTIIASPGHWEGPFHWKNRKLNIRELAAIQTFPDDYSFYGSYNSVRKQIGNAVPPLLSKLIVKELCKWI